MELNDWLNLNGVWEFQRAEAGDAVAGSKQLESMILVPFQWESALSGMRKQSESRPACYRRAFTVPA